MLSLLYLQCNNHFTNQEIELSKDELWDLFKVSYKHYQTEVINDRKIYNRYVNDLISYHLPVFTSDEEAIRKHFQNLFCVYELLTDRKDLVEKYFTKSTFEKTDFSKMLNEFNHVEVILKDSNGLASFNRKQIKLITDFANRKNFFTTPVDENTIEKFFNCTLKDSYSHKLALYTSAVIFPFPTKMIPYNWVSLVVRNKMLAPQKSMIPSTHWSNQFTSYRTKEYYCYISRRRICEYSKTTERNVLK